MRLKIHLQHSKSVGLGLHSFVTLIFILALSNTTVAQSTLTLDSVSVNENNHVIIGWTLETDVEDGFIEIHRSRDDGGYEELLFSLPIPLTQSSYLDTGINAGNIAYSYYVVARDPNDDSFAVSLEAHKTLFQKPSDYDICNRHVFISWSNYKVTTSAGTPEPLPVPFDNTNVIWSFNDQGFTNQTAVDINAEHLFFPVEEEGKYCFKLRSYHSETNISSTSNERCIDVKFAPAPQFIEVRRLSLDENSENVEIDLLVDSSADGVAYILQ